ncbi:MAG: MiaB/RimO family radical SAM methylthiotransferase, partial [Treponema sp.]|nr:MiaB/RimO family radical SAM methylthiotransferase [Treponema sp.]
MRYFLDPFGCVKNQVDAETMMAHLDNAGWESTQDSGLAELIIVNSCGFIESAKQESINAVLEWRKLYPEKKILLTGCLAQRYAKELPDLLPEADGFLGVDDILQIVKMADKTAGNSLPLAENSQSSKFKPQLIPGERPLLSLPGSAYVKISEGCSNNCSYCAIPLIRGRLVSRAIPDITEECRVLIKRGKNELCIIGQDIGAFGSDNGAGHGLPELLNAISELDGNFWIRLLYIHPDHFPLRILDLMEKDKRFLPYFDIPFQHASEKILNAMNRGNSFSLLPFVSGSALPKNDSPLREIPANLSEKYLALINTIRTRLPNAVIRSTFLLGFPGETEDDFAALLDFQEKANLDWLGCFTYSREEGTPSYSMKKRVPAKTAALRKKIIEEKQMRITEKNMERFTGQTLDVLVEEKIAADPSTDETDSENIWLGRLYCQAPDIDGSAVIICD